MAAAASAPQKGWSDVGGFRMSPKWIGGKKNAAEKEGGGSVNVGKDDTTGNEWFPSIKVTKEKLGLVKWKSPRNRKAL